MFDSIGSQVNRIPSEVFLAIIIVSLLLLLIINFGSSPMGVLKAYLQNLKLPKKQSKPKQQPLTPKQTLELSNSLVGKFMTEDLVDNQEVIGLKGTLISEHIVFEAEKRGLLGKLASISVFWPIET